MCLDLLLHRYSKRPGYSAARVDSLSPEHRKRLFLPRGGKPNESQHQRCPGATRTWDPLRERVRPARRSRYHCDQRAKYPYD
jgi:hypothetical protein